MRRDPSSRLHPEHLREDFVEFAFGEPDPALLPVGLVREAAERALAAPRGAGALAYGSNAGPEALLRGDSRAYVGRGRA